MITNRLLFFDMGSCDLCVGRSRSLSTLSSYICCDAGYVVAFRAIVVVVMIPVLYIW